jgi:hypothetical protein
MGPPLSRMCLCQRANGRSGATVAEADERLLRPLVATASATPCQCHGDGPGRARRKHPLSSSGPGIVTVRLRVTDRSNGGHWHHWQKIGRPRPDPPPSRGDSKSADEGIALAVAHGARLVLGPDCRVLMLLEYPGVSPTGFALNNCCGSLASFRLCQAPSFMCAPENADSRTYSTSPFFVSLSWPSWQVWLGGLSPPCTSVRPLRARTRTQTAGHAAQREA